MRHPAADVYIIESTPPNPDEFPVTTPIPLTVANPGIIELQVPPGVMSLKLTVEPPQSVSLPVIGAGVGLTVNVIVAIQLVGKVYVITEVPVKPMSVTTPVVD